MTTAPTLRGVLIKHRGHLLAVTTEYVVQPGHVYGVPHIIVWCQTDKAEVWNEALDAQEVGYYTIRAEDVGKNTITGWGRRWSVSFMGHIMKQDVGKRIYKVATDDGSDEILQIESEGQLERRLVREQRERAAGRTPIVTRPLIRTRNKGTS